MHKVSQVAELAEERRPELAVEVDGGMHAATVGEAATAGATVVVADSAVFDAFRPGDRLPGHHAHSGQAPLACQARGYRPFALSQQEKGSGP